MTFYVSIANDSTYQVYGSSDMIPRGCTIPHRHNRVLFEDCDDHLKTVGVPCMLDYLNSPPTHSPRKHGHARPGMNKSVSYTRTKI